MSTFSHLDSETFRWVKSEIRVTLDAARESLQAYSVSGDQNLLFDISNHLHQVVGSLQMLELKSLSSLLLESELLIEDFTTTDSVVEKSSLTSLLELAFATLENSFTQIESGLPENTTVVVELINQHRAVRGLDDVEISSLFSPNIEVFPEIDSEKALKGDAYQQKIATMRSVFQVNLLQWLRGDDLAAVQNIRDVVEVVFSMSRFSAVARLWWVASAYVDFLAHNALQSKAVHGRMLRQLDDCLRKLEVGGESALVRDPSEELIKVMLFYTGVSEHRTERMEEVVDAFGLQSYFPSLAELTPVVPYGEYKSRLNEVAELQELPLPVIRQLVTSYFDDDKTDIEQLDEIRQQLRVVANLVAPADVEIVNQVVAECITAAKNLRVGVVGRNEESGFHFASALIFLEHSLNGLDAVDEHWLQNGQLKLRALQALNNQEEVDSALDGVNLTGSERQALLDVVGSEVEENLKEIESNLEEFAADRTRFSLLKGIDSKIRQIRGALQILGEQKVGLLLQLAENQFTAIEQREAEATTALTEALAIAIGTMEAYVKGLQTGQAGMDHLLDRSITDLEVAIGKTVSRNDVESLLDNTSNALFTWLANQSEFQLFTDVKSGLRDLLILAKKTKLVNVEHLISEQTRLVDVIAQEPAFLTDNITNNLQNNMASITVQIIDLYGTKETAEEIQFDEDFAARNQAIRSDDDGIRYHDAMDLAEVVPTVEEDGPASLTSTEIGKQNAVDQTEQPMIDDAIFEVFIEESHEVLEQANEQYEACLKDSNDLPAIRDLRRSFHTLKGSGRMVGLNNIAEIAWFSESLMNYCLDTSKPLSGSLMQFLRKSLDEFNSHFLERYQSQHLIDVAQWGSETEAVDLDGEPLTNEIEHSDSDLVTDQPSLSDEQLADNLTVGAKVDTEQQEHDLGLIDNTELDIDAISPIVIDLDADVDADSSAVIDFDSNEFAASEIEFVVDASLDLIDQPEGAVDLGLMEESDSGQTDGVALPEEPLEIAGEPSVEDSSKVEVIDDIVIAGETIAQDDVAAIGSSFEADTESTVEDELETDLDFAIESEAAEDSLDIAPTENTIELDDEAGLDSPLEFVTETSVDKDDIALTENTIELEDEAELDSTLEFVTEASVDKEDIALTENTIELDDEAGLDSILEFVTESSEDKEDITLTENIIDLDDEAGPDSTLEFVTEPSEDKEDIALTENIIDLDDEVGPDSTLEFVTETSEDKDDITLTENFIDLDDEAELEPILEFATDASEEKEDIPLTEDIVELDDNVEPSSDSEIVDEVEVANDALSDDAIISEEEAGILLDLEFFAEPELADESENVALSEDSLKPSDSADNVNDLEFLAELEPIEDVENTKIIERTPEAAGKTEVELEVDLVLEQIKTEGLQDTDSGDPIEATAADSFNAEKNAIDNDEQSANVPGSELDEGTDSDDAAEEIADEKIANSSKETSQSVKDTDLQAIASSVIRDPQMREIFLHEAGTNLGLISEQLAVKPLYVEEDDVMSICVHTIKGNARTMGLDDLAGVFGQAEELCMLKQRSGVKINESERVCLSLLVRVTKEYLATESDQAPYFHSDDLAWAGLSSDLDKALEAIAPQLSVLEMDSDREDEFDADGSAVNELDASDATPPISDEEASARVAAVFEELDPMDDLLEDSLFTDTPVSNEVFVEEAVPSNELTDLEKSLESFTFNAPSADLRSDLSQQPDAGADDEAQDRISDATQQEASELDQPDDGAAKQSVEDDALSQEDGAQQSVDDASANDINLPEQALEELPELEDEPLENEDDAKSRKSLLPDELTDLVDDDPIDVDSAIASEASFVINETEHELETLNEESDEEQDRPSVEEAEESDQTQGEPYDDVSDGEPDGEPDVEPEEEHDPELRAIYVDELRTLHHELDNEVASLTNLNDMAPAMANIMRNLHTIKGNSLMANERALGEVTHHAESFLEQNFIRNADDLRSVRLTLEQYSDSVDNAIQVFDQGARYRVPAALSKALGVSVSSNPPASPPIVVKAEPIAEVDFSTETDTADESVALSDSEVVENVDIIAASIEEIDSKWKSARGWAQSKQAMLDQYQALSEISTQNNLLDPVLPLVKQGQAYMHALKPKNAAEFREAKALLAELSDVVAANASRLSSGLAVQGVSELQAQFDIGLGKVGVDKALAGQMIIEKSGDAGLADKRARKRDKAARDRATALRIKTETLDSLTNFVGDASMNRAQMREDVLSVKSVIEDLYTNIQGLGGQLRELEIEADSKISARSTEIISNKRDDEFDPLELDRYTKLQQLSRGLTESLDELSGIQGELNAFVYKAETSLQKQDRLNRELREEILQVRLVQFGGVAPQLRQVVRRTARETNKEAELEVIGTDVRLDKSILDGVIPALEHMLRNAVDHGIEKPAVRSKQNKSEVGKVVVECRQVAREILITVRDDGVGLNLDKIRATAIENNLLTENQKIKPEDVLMYISQSGFSTADSLTHISGRGVGMDVVQSTLRRMSGSIVYDFDNDRSGSSFTIRLPISLAVSSAVFIDSGNTHFAVSSRTVERIVNIDSSELLTHLKEDKPQIDVDGLSYALIDLAEYLGYTSKLAMISGKRSVILVNSGVQNIAVIIDELLDTQEIVVKNLGEHLGRIPIYAGATIRANGDVVLMLDLVGLSYYESFISLPDQAESISDSGFPIPRVLVVDDSLTVRKSAERDIVAMGIVARLAKDGLDAQVQLDHEMPDMILLDIEMPRMDGFEFLEWLKSNDKTAHIPVIMISSRATDKYIKKATDLGCSGFLGKPYLLENLALVFNQHLELETPITLDKG